MAKKLFLISLFLICSGCPTELNIEVCVYREADGLEHCFDGRLPPGEQSYTRNPRDKDISTNPQDFQTMIEACELKGSDSQK